MAGRIKLCQDQGVDRGENAITQHPRKISTGMYAPLHYSLTRSIVITAVNPRGWLTFSNSSFSGAGWWPSQRLLMSVTRKLAFFPAP